MYHRTSGDVAQRQRIPRHQLRVGARRHLLADLQTLGSDDVALLAVGVLQERNARRAVRVVLDCPHLGHDAELAALPVDDAVETLVAAAAVAHGDAALRVAAGALLERLGERLLRPRGRNLLEGVAAHPSPTRRG